MVQIAALSAKVTADTTAAEKNLGGVQSSLLKTGAAFDQTGARANRMRLITLQVAETQAKLSAETDELRRAMLKVKLDDLTRQYQGLANAQEGAATKTQGFGEKLMAAKGAIMMTAAAVIGFGVAVKKAFDFAAEGAAVEQTTVSFNRLGVSLEDLRAASNGTVDDMTLMSATLTLTAGASEQLQASMLQSAPRLLEIAKAANALNPTLGDTAFMYESISRGIKRSSPLILDNLGIIIKVGQANEDYAAILGKTVEAMTADEKQIALLNATLESGARLIEQAGGEANSAVDPFARLGAAISNYTSDLKRDFSPTLAGAANGIAGFVDNMRTAEAVNREWHESGNIVNDVASNLAIKFEILRETLGGNNTAIDRYNERLVENAAVGGLAAGQMADYAEMARETSGAVDGMSESTEELTEVTMASRQSLSELHAIMKGALGEQIEKFTEQQATARERVAELTGEIDILAGKRYLTAEQQEELDGLQEELLATRSTIAGNAQAHEEATRRILFGYMQQRLAIDGLTTDELAALQEVAKEWGLIDNATYLAIEAIDDAATAVEEGYDSWDGFISRVNTLDGSLRNLPAVHDFTLNYHTKYFGERAEQEFDMMGASGGASGGTGTGTGGGGSDGGGPRDEIHMASGFEGVFNRPTRALFGEAEPEYVFAMPVSQMQGGGGGAGGAAWSGDININGANDPQAVAAAVMGVLRERGIIAAHALR